MAGIDRELGSKYFPDTFGRGASGVKSIGNRTKIEIDLNKSEELASVQKGVQEVVREGRNALHEVLNAAGDTLKGVQGGMEVTQSALNSGVQAMKDGVDSIKQIPDAIGGVKRSVVSAIDFWGGVTSAAKSVDALLNGKGQQEDRVSIQTVFRESVENSGGLSAESHSSVSWRADAVPAPKNP